MGIQLEQHYENHGVEVIREAASGMGVRYFLSATKQRSSKIKSEEILVGYRQKARIRDVLAHGVDYIIFGSLGGNDAYAGCCSGKRRQKMIKMYQKLFKQLCGYNTIVIFNGSPPAQGKRHQKFDRRRKALDEIQHEAAKGTCVIRNSTRQLLIPSDKDGYHYNKSARLYVEYLVKLPGMELPILEAGR